MSQDFRESKQPKTSCPFPPIILVSYKHTRLAQNTFERERGVRKNETGAGVTTNFVNRWRCGQRHKIRGREGGENKIGKVEKEQRVSCGASGHKMFLQLPSTAKSSLNFPKSQVPLHHNPKCPSFPSHQKNPSSSISLASSIKNPKVFFRQPSSEQSQRKAEWPPWDLRLFSMANLFNSTHECLGQKKSLEGVLHKCQLGCRRQANPSSESKSFLVNQLLRGVGVILS